MANKKKASFVPDGDEEPSRQSAWMVTFGDSMSLLLTFFVLLISFSSFDEVKISSTMEALTEHLGGGAKAGSKIVKASYNIAGEEIQVTETDIRKKLIESPLPSINEQVFELDLGGELKRKKLDTIKELLASNPSLLNVVLQDEKKKKNMQEVEKELPKYMDEHSVDLALQNFKHLLQSEQLDDRIKVQRNEFGEVVFHIDCGLFFYPGDIELLPDSEELLIRIAGILTRIDNEVLVENMISPKLMLNDDDETLRSLLHERGLAIINRLKTINTDIEIGRFSLFARGYSEEDWSEIQKLNVSGEGVVGIIIVP